MLIDQAPRKVFELPKAGVHLAVLADLIYLKDVPTAYGLKNQIRFIWILEKNDSEGNRFRAVRQVNQTMGDGSSLMALVTSIRNGVPPSVPFETEELIGSVNILGITRTQGVDKKTGKPREFANVASVNPADEGQVLGIPKDFIRDKDKDKTKQTGQAKTGTTTSAPAIAPVGAALVDNTPVVQF